MFYGERGESSMVVVILLINDANSFCGPRCPFIFLVLKISAYGACFYFLQKGQSGFAKFGC